MRAWRRGCNAAPSPVLLAMITVTSVENTGVPDAIWFFSSAVTLGAGTVPALEIDVGAGYVGPLVCVQEDWNAIRATYDVQSLDGASWRVVATPIGLSEAAQVVVPEAGLVL